jgi:hypothetical protein
VAPWIALTLIACGGAEEDGPDDTPIVDNDIDGDGLTNDYEQNLFNPSSDPYKFNPQIADLPTLRVQLMSPPKIVLDVESSVTTATQLTTATPLRPRPRSPPPSPRPTPPRSRPRSLASARCPPCPCLAP